MHKKTWKRALFALVAGTTFISSIGLSGCLNAALTAIPVGAGFTLGASISQNLGLGGALGGLGGV